MRIRPLRRSSTPCLTAWTPRCLPPQPSTLRSAATTREGSHLAADVGDEWAHERRFPESGSSRRERLTRRCPFRLLDFGPGESPLTPPGCSRTARKGLRRAGARLRRRPGYDHMHGYLADGNYEDSLGNIARARRELGGTVLHMGHGSPGPAAPLLDWQEGYIRASSTHFAAPHRRAFLRCSGAGSHRGHEALPSQRRPPVPHAPQRRTPCALLARVGG